MTDASDADLAHLFGVKKPFLAPLWLSQALISPRPLTADEAAQLCERDAAIKPTTRKNWELAPITINGKLHAALSQMSERNGRHPVATWHLPVAPAVGVLRLCTPLGSGRALSPIECRQLRSFDKKFTGANPAWSVIPNVHDACVVTICRDPGRKMVIIADAVSFAIPSSVPTPRARHRMQRFEDLPAPVRARAAVLVF